MNNTHKRVSDLLPGDTFVNTATRYTVQSIETAQMSHPSNSRHMLVTTDKGDLKVPATLLVKVV